MDQYSAEGVLLEDVFSSVAKRTNETRPFGRKGETVKVIRVSENVMIVQGMQGNRFTVEREAIQIKTQK